MIIDDKLSSCGFIFNSWQCAGYSTSWFVGIAISSLELLFWISTWISQDLWPIYLLFIEFVGQWGNITLNSIPLVLWIISVSIGETTLEDNFLWTFVMAIVFDGLLFFAHYFFVPQLKSLTEEFNTLD